MKPRWNNYTVVSKQKVDVSSCFEEEKNRCLEEIKKSCLESGKTYDESKIKFRYRVLKKNEYKTSVSANAAIYNKSDMGKASIDTKGLLKGTKSGTVAIVLEYKDKEGKKKVWKSSANSVPLFVAIEKIKIKKDAIKSINIGQTIEISDIFGYEKSDQIGNEPNFYQSLKIETGKKDILIADEEKKTLTGNKKGKSKIKITYISEIGKTKDGKPKYSKVTLSGKITIK